MKKATAIFALIGIGVMGRLLPHPPNATPITGITIAARRSLGARWTFAVPVIAMLLSDAVIGFYDWRILCSVYGSFLLIALLSYAVRQTEDPLAILLAALVSSLLFFFVTNFAVWLFSPWYEKSLSGLLYCYLLGLPFLRTMALGDLFYTFGLLAAERLARRTTPVRSSYFAGALSPK